MSFMDDTEIIDPARTGLANILRVVPNCSLYNSVILWLYLKLCILSNCTVFKKKAELKNFNEPVGYSFMEHLQFLFVLWLLYLVSVSRRRVASWLNRLVPLEDP